MTVREALRRIVARAMAQADFDPTGITDVEQLRTELMHEFPEMFIASTTNQQHPPAKPQPN